MQPYPSRMRELRIYFGMDQAEMGRWLGTKQSVISLWETGKRTPPLRDVAVRFGVSVDWLERLSTVMWGERVRELGQRYRTELTRLSAAQKEELLAFTPSERVAHTFAWLNNAAPDLVSADYYARLLGLTPSAFESLLRNEAGVAPTALKRLADFIGIPEGWYITAESSLLQPLNTDEYASLIREMLAEGISPADLRKVWKAIRQSPETR